MPIRGGMDPSLRDIVISGREAESFISHTTAGMHRGTVRRQHAELMGLSPAQSSCASFDEAHSCTNRPMHCAQTEVLAVMQGQGGYLNVCSSGKTLSQKRAGIVFEASENFADFQWPPGKPAANMWQFRSGKKKAGYFLHGSLCARCSDLARVLDYQARNCIGNPPKINFTPTQWELVSTNLTGAALVSGACSLIWKQHAQVSVDG